MWVQRGLADARMLVDRAGLTETSRVLDWGSGPGRLLAGIHRLLGPIQSYIGIDVKADVIDWASANLASAWTTFVHVDQHNERYNAQGQADHSLPLPPASIDILCAFSVFTPHAQPRRGWLQRRDGSAAATGRDRGPKRAFVEFDVPPDVENPEGYLPDTAWAGPLHCVRYKYGYLTDLIRMSGLEIVSFIHRDPGRAGQSLLFAESGVRQRQEERTVR